MMTIGEVEVVGFNDGVNCRLICGGGYLEDGGFTAEAVASDGNTSLFEWHIYTFSSRIRSWRSFATLDQAFSDLKSYIATNGKTITKLETHDQDKDVYAPYLTWYTEDHGGVYTAITNGGSGESGISLYVRQVQSNNVIGKEWFEVSIDLPMLYISWEMHDVTDREEARNIVDRFYERNEGHLLSIVDNEKANTEYEWN